MIREQDKYFFVETKSLSYIFHVNELGVLLHDHFGVKLDVGEDKKFLGLKEAYPKGTSVILDSEKDPNFSLDNQLLEYSFANKGDFKEPALLMKNSRGYTFDFRYDSFEIRTGEDIKFDESLPAPHHLDEELIVTLKEQSLDIKVELHYYANNQYNVVVRNTVLINNSGEDLVIEKIASMQLDVVNKQYYFTSLNGSWIGECHAKRQKLYPGIYINDSKTGNSSAKHNPFFIVAAKEMTEDYGEGYSFNLMYSGNHQELLELNIHDHLHIQNGINPFMFEWTLKNGEKFITPYALLAYSDKGTNLLAHRMHNFINNCVVNENFTHRLRPVLINNWEGTYFKFKESTLIKIAKQASKVGIELFVLDDGWFGERNDDSHGLGDYDVNKKKLPGGLTRLAKKINKLGMDFGLWVEPEGVNKFSKCYEQHPDWIIHCRDIKPSESRNEYLLDLSKKEVQDYIIENVSNTLKSANIKYIKWDMNRNMSDIGSDRYNPGEFFHRYILGLYRCMRELTTAFPDILFEGCASGGNRFDLGILRYFPQIWGSDNTDSYTRVDIQNGYYLGYPPSTITGHVSHKTNHQMLRNTTYNAKFAVAAFTDLGYELKLDELSKLELVEIKKQVEFYKAHRELLQFGNFYKVLDKHYPGDNASWLVLSHDKKEAIISYFKGVQTVHTKETFLKGFELTPGKKYEVTVFGVEHDIKMFGSLINMVLPFHVNPEGHLVALISKHKGMGGEVESYVVDGSVLNDGLLLKSEWSGTGFNENVRVLGDFGARLYYIHQVD